MGHKTNTFAVKYLSLIRMPVAPEVAAWPRGGQCVSSIPLREVGEGVKEGLNLLHPTS